MDLGCDDLFDEGDGIAGCKCCWIPCQPVGSCRHGILTEWCIFCLLCLVVRCRTIFRGRIHHDRWLPLWKPMGLRWLERFLHAGWICWWDQNCLLSLLWCGPLVFWRFVRSVVDESWSMICWFLGGIWRRLHNLCWLGRLLSIEGSFDRLIVCWRCVRWPKRFGKV